MKISQLTQATAVTNDDLLPIVQNGETKKVTRETLIGTVPDDVTFEDGKLHLIAEGKTVGDGADIPIPEVDQTIAENSENAVSGNAVKAYVDGSLSGTIKQYSSYYDRETLQTGRKTVTYDGGSSTGRVGKFIVSHQSGSQYASFEEEIIFGVQPHDSSDPEDFIPFFSNSPTAPYMDGNMYIGMMGEWMSLRDLLVPALTEAFGENAVVINESLWQPSDNDWGGAKLGACRYWYLCEIHVGQDEITALDEIFNGIIQLKNMAEIRFDWRDAVNKTVKEAALL